MCEPFRTKSLSTLATKNVTTKTWRLLEGFPKEEEARRKRRGGGRGGEQGGGEGGGGGSRSAGRNVWNRMFVLKNIKYRRGTAVRP